MREFRTSIEIDAPMEQAWNVLADLERWPEWTASVASVEVLDPGPPAVGTRARVCQPKLRPVVWTITEWHPPHRFVWVASSIGLRMTAGHELTRRGTGSALLLTLTFAGPLAAVAALAGGKLARQYMDLEANGLKARSEAPVSPVRWSEGPA